MQDGFAATKSHGRIHYLEAGAGPVILLMHSNGNSAYEYDELIALLADRYRVIAMDFPGHGDSEPPKRHYTVGDYGDCAIELMDALDIRTASILGSSIGGAVCIDIGVRHADRVESLFVVESPLRTAEQWRERWFVTEKGYGILVQTAEQLKPRLRHVSEDLLERWNIDRGKAGTWAMMALGLAGIAGLARRRGVGLAGECGGDDGGPGSHRRHPHRHWHHHLQRQQ
jgi:pimeloyl-ACP methyl ester carboxylesterase